MKFRSIVGNPPYQKNTKGGTGGRDLWDKFVDISLSKLCNDDGSVALIHPSKWRSPEHYIWELLTKNNIMNLEIHSAKSGQKTFNVSTRYDWYVVRKSNDTSDTNVVDELGNKHKINLKNIPFLPNYNFDDFWSIMARGNEPRCNVLYSRSIYGNDKKHMSKSKNNKNKYPCIYSMYKDGSHKLLFSSKNSGHFGVPKVILNCGGSPYPFIDIKGEYGMCNNSFGLVVDDVVEAKRIKKAIDSDRFLEIIKATKWHTYQISYKMFKYFKKDFLKVFI